MSDKRFVDSNIWLYAFMDSTSDKRSRALHLIEGEGITLSTQVINEVCVNLLRKGGYSEPEIQQTIGNFQARYPILNLTANIIYQASVLRNSYSFSYWDSLIIATAVDANCSIVYSEDMQNGLRIVDLIIINPFVTDS
jgi:predicted nucleic acid-binding protein